MREFIARLLGTFRRRGAESRLDVELRLHEELLAEELGDASAARRELGRGSVRDEYYDRAGLPWLETIAKDLWFGVRLLRKSPGFATVAVLTLALGIGGSTAMFSLLYHVLLKPLPYPQPDRLAITVGIAKTEGFAAASMPDYLDFRAQNSAFEHLAAHAGRTSNITDPGPVEVVRGAQVSDNFFGMIGVAPLAGSTLDAATDNRPVVVISHEMWRNRFASAAAAIGGAIALDGVVHYVVGIMPPDFNLPGGAKFWTHFGDKARNQSRRADFLSVIGRMKPEVSIGQAAAEVRTIASRLEQQYPETNTGRGAAVVPLQDFMVRDARTPLLMLFAAVSLLLLIACVNIALLMLARGSSRRREILIRASLGASRARIASQLLCESLIVSLCGAAAGTLLASVAVRTWQRWGAAAVPRSGEVTVDAAVLAFSVAVAAVAAVLFSALPIRRAVRVNVASDLRSRGALSSGRSMPALVISQAVLATTLLIGAALLGRSLATLMSVNPGYWPDGVLTASVALAGDTYRSPASVAQFHDRILERVRAIPGVTSAATATFAPAAGGNRDTFSVDGLPLQFDNVPKANLRGASVGYLRTAGIELMAGRDFTEADRGETQLVALVNRTLVRQYFEGRDPIGQRIAIDGPAWRTIVGVTADVRQEGLDQPPAAEVIVPMAQRATRGPVILIRTDGDPRLLAPSLRTAIAAIDPQLPIGRIATLNELRDGALAQPAFRTWLLAAFASLALLLASLGVFGMLSYSVAERTAEIGVRMALGATAGAVRSMLLSRAALLSAAGCVGGVTLAAMLSRGVRTLLFEVSPHDALSFTAAPLIVLAASTMAAYLPARRATRVDPSVALRVE